MGLVLLAGEQIKLREPNVRVVVKNLGDGTMALAELVVTTWRIVFLSGASKNPITVALAALDTINIEQTPGRTKAEVVVQLELVCRDFQVVTVLFPNGAAGKNVMTLLTNHRTFSHRFPFDHFEASGGRGSIFGRYDPVVDFARMDLPNERFSINVTLNRNFQCCPSYPQVLCVPAGLEDKVLFKSAAFRTKRRFPVVVWRSAKFGGCLLRSSQPHVGVSRARCEEDELLLRTVSNACDASKVLLICDARPKINAMANHATTSGGSENPAFYPFVVLIYGDIENIHNARASFDKLLAALTTRSDDVDDFDKRVRASGWQKHLYTILACAKTLADWLLEGKSTLVHW